MDKFINATQLIMQMERTLIEKASEHNSTGYMAFKEFIQLLRELPAADVIEVIRCKDCKYFIVAKYHTGEPYTGCMYYGTDNVEPCNKNAYCSYAERR